MVRKHTYFFIAFLLFLFSWATLNSQTVNVSLDSWSSMRRLSTPQQEKLYLHFDKPYYAAGERMWFRAYLLDATNLTADTTSKAVYVELINSRDSIISRQKLNKIDGFFSGSFYLYELLPEGIYRVRAYTNWMRNAGNTFFYQHPFFIGNSISSQIKTSIQFTFQGPKKALAEIKFIQNNAPLAAKKILYKLNIAGKKSTRVNTETTTDGKISIAYNPLKLKDKKPSVSVTYEDTISKYDRTFVLSTKNDFDVQLFPEGGEIVNGTTNCVAFKAIKTDGLSIDVQGTLYDTEGQKVSDFKSEHLGMGKFYFLTEIYKHYYVVFKTASGETKRIDLPKPKKDVFALAAVVKYGRILVSVKSEMGRMVKDSLTLLGHIGGTVFYRETISGFTPAVLFDTKDMHPGIAHFVLLDKDGKPISERLVFVKPKRMADVNLDFMKLVHDKRERVTCVLDANDSKGKPIVNGSFSIAVTDANAVLLDPGNDNIMSNLLLTSDIKGFIEKPGLYFDPDFKNADDALDLLLMTQAWKRFDISDALKGEIKQASHPIEKGYEISGQVSAGKNKPLKGVQVLVYAPNIQYFNSAESDKEGNFSFNNLFFPEKTQFTIEARRKKTLKEDIRISVNEQDLPEIDENIFPADAVTPVTDEYLQAANEKYYNENGTRNVYARNRGLISFTPQKIIEESNNPNISYSDEDYVLEGATLDRFNRGDLPSLLKKLPVLTGWNEQIQPKTSAGDNSHEEIIIGPRFAIDGIIYSYNEVKNIKVEDLESIHVLRSSEATDKKKSLDNTLISLSFKMVNPISASADKQKIISVMPLGYADNVLFYEPKYQFFADRTNPIADWRSTITFIPQVTTGPTGKAIFSFFTSDRVSPYNIVIEGISPEGEPCRMVTKKMLLSKEYLHKVE